MLEAEEEDDSIDLTSLDQVEADRRGRRTPNPATANPPIRRSRADDVIVEMEDPWAESSTPSGDGSRAGDDDRPQEFSDERGETCRST